MKGNVKIKRNVIIKHIAAAALTVLIVMIVLWSIQTEKKHNFEGQCNLCHVGMKDPSVLTREIDRLCLSCHPDNAKRSHPSGIIPSQELPAQYPMMRGHMVCTSCHFPHPRKGPLPTAGADTPAAGVTSPGPYMLRSARAGKTFCYSCHRAGFTTEAVDSHAISINKAHTNPKGLDFDQKQLLDDNSRECLSCHDGTVSTSTHTQIRSLSWQHKKDIGMSHPIGVDYEQVYLSKQKYFHPPERLDPKITLINGKLGCETCHNHYSKEKKHLVMNNRGSRLCLSCHDL
jgi:predicted CXXCH cytochrome family protein